MPQYPQRSWVAIVVRAGDLARSEVMKANSLQSRTDVMNSNEPGPMMSAALRSQDPELIEQVRRLIAEFGLPLTIHPLGSPAPQAIALFDSYTESQRTDPSWQQRTRNFHWVSLTADPNESSVRVLPAEAHRIRRTLEWSIHAQSARMFGFIGSAGGVGTTCLAMNVARECVNQGIPTVLVDCSSRSSIGAYLNLGVGTRWQNVNDEAALDDGYALIESLPVWQGVRVLTGSETFGFSENALASHVVAQLARTARLIVLDFGSNQVAEELAPWCDEVLVVSTIDQLGLWGVQQLEQVLGSQQLGLVVRRNSGDAAAPSELELATRVPIRGILGHERTLRGSMERGMDPGDQRRGPIRRLARQLSQELVGVA